MTTVFWMSFADPDLPEGSQFLGVVIIRAENIAAAITLSHANGLNPGGEIEILEMPDNVAPPPEWMDRLLDRDAAERLVALMRSAP